MPTSSRRSTKARLPAQASTCFPTEPLPATSPLWTHPKVTITPHNAGYSDPRALAVNVLNQIERFERGEPLANVIDRSAGY